MGSQEKPSNPFTAEITQFINDTLKDWHVPGLSIAVIDGENVYTEVHTQSTSCLMHTNSPGIWTRRLPRHASSA